MTVIATGSFGVGVSAAEAGSVDRSVVVDEKDVVAENVAHGLSGEMLLRQRYTGE
ncbi:MAG: hypothetical protein R3C03_00050 [Pirellulaceae bacterium]